MELEVRCTVLSHSDGSVISAGLATDPIATGRLPSPLHTLSRAAVAGLATRQSVGALRHAATLDRAVYACGTRCSGTLALISSDVAAAHAVTLYDQVRYFDLTATLTDVNRSLTHAVASTAIPSANSITASPLSSTSTSTVTPSLSLLTQTLSLLVSLPCLPPVCA